MSWTRSWALGAIPSPTSTPGSVGVEGWASLSPTVVPDVCVPWKSFLEPQVALLSYAVAPGRTQ